MAIVFSQHPAGLFKPPFQLFPVALLMTLPFL
jgi:hypothetical protein